MESINNTLQLAERLAAEGKYREALSLLDSLKDIADGIPENDALILRAKIFFQTGEYDKAIDTWQNVLSVDPQNRHAIKGIQAARRLKTIPLLGKSPFRFYAIKRFGWLLPVLLVASFFSLRRIQAPERPVDVPRPRQASPLEKPGHTVPLKAEKTARVKPSPGSQTAPVYRPLDRMAGIKVIDEKDGEVLVFENGLFPKGGSTIDRKAFPLLDRLACAIKEREKAIRLIIMEGHASNLPIKKKAPWSSNYELALVRAKSVIHYFVKDNGLPPSIFLATSTGSFDPPFPVEEREKNRTVVIRILRK